MMSGVPLETCWAFNKLWNNKFYYKVASCWLFLLICTTMHASMNIKFVNVTQSCLVAVYRNFWAAYRSYCSLKKGPVSCPATPENKETLADSDRQTDRVRRTCRHCQCITATRTQVGGKLQRCSIWPFIPSKHDVHLSKFSFQLIVNTPLLYYKDQLADTP